MALKFKYLMCVTGEKNSNKWYKMVENADGTFTATYGREGAKGAIETYSMSMWDKKLNEKLSSKKGYTDVTEHRTEAVATPVVKNSNGTNIISHDKHVADIISALQGYANQQTATVYKAEAKGVTQKQIDDAQKHIDNLSHSFKNYYGKKEWSDNLFNTELTKLYIIIPRKMKNVADHLISSTTTKSEIEALIGQEQSNLDSMAGQVIQQAAQVAADDTSATATQQTLLDILGLEMSLVTDQKLYAQLKAKAEDNEQHKKVNRIFSVTNKATQAAFDKKVTCSTNKKTKLLFHGSRNANWWFLVQQGVRIRPSGVTTNGAMWDSGCYYASDAGKSLGYTDIGRYVNGSANKVYMAFYEVHVGKQLIKTSHDSSCYGISKECKNKGFDSVWAKKGAGVVRDEYIIYNSEQSTIKYLIEFNA